ncbi:MAG: cytochrome c maturation protein CcmE [Acidimicrobiales bacterium]
MNALLGFGFVTLGLAASVLGAAGGAYALQSGQLQLLKTVRQWALLFTISFGGEDALVRHIGNEPSSLFKFGERVVAKGRWDGETFESSQVVVKHSEEYVEDNPSRVDYELDETVPEAG